MSTVYLPAFSATEYEKAKILLATQVVNMMGRKFEEADWGTVYCGAKGIPESNWSNLHIDINHNGFGVEHKMKCETPTRSLKELCGTTLMHPAATRSIRIESTDCDPNVAMRDVLKQYGNLIKLRAQSVQEQSPESKVDMRTGWLIWERSLTEFLYFEESLVPPNPKDYYAQWNERESQGARKSSKNLWIYEKATGKKKYSVTTVAGAKIQPYFDIPPPNSKSLYYFKVQGEELKNGRILIWISASTVRELQLVLGEDIGVDVLSKAVIDASHTAVRDGLGGDKDLELAVPLELTRPAYNRLREIWDGVSDEHRTQLLVQTLRGI